MLLDIIFENILVYFSYTGLFFILVLGGLLPLLPEEIILLMTGYIAFLGVAKLPLAIGVAFLGIFGADCLGYYVGKKKGRDVLLAVAEEGAYWRKIFVKGKLFFDAHGELAILLGRFFIGVRFAIPMLAGALGVSWKKFFQYDILGAAIWSLVTVGGGYIISYSLDQAAIFTEKRIFYIGFITFIIIYSVWRFFKYK